ncbi:hypothetical protein [Roseobacter sp.]|uniref:hypothetical protein n=1 Tax=Roseobacter sp. TaxID=1907202 RepID=UPI00385BEA46
MSDHNVQETDRLRSLLKELQSAPTSAHDGNRKIVVSEPNGALNTVLQEIDRTVLPRALHISAGDEKRIVLYAAERRLLRLSLENDKDFAASNSSSGELSGRDAASIAQVLLDFCVGVTEIGVQARFVEKNPGEDSFGVSLDDIKAQLDHSVDGTGCVNPFEEAIEASKKFALAIYIDRGCGTDEIIGQQDLGFELCSMNKSWSETDFRGNCTIWSGPTPKDPSILVSNRSGDRVWIAFAAKDIETCVACWVDVTRPAN